MGFAAQQEEFPEQMQEQMTEDFPNVMAHMEIPDGHASAMDHVDFVDIATQFWWVGVIFIIGMAFTAKALYRVGIKIPVINEILKMWKKT